MSTSKDVLNVMDSNNELKKYEQAEKKLFEKLDKMKNAGLECDCDTPDEFSYIHVGNFDEIMCRCLKCGGDIITIR